jgi:hypothetical protein
VLVVPELMRRVSVSLVAMLAAVLAGCGGGGSPTSGQTHPHAMLYLEGGAKGGLDRLVALDVHTGRARTLPIPVGCTDATDCLVASGGKLVIASGGTSVYDPRRPGRPRVRQIGNAWAIVPSATDGRVWLAVRDHRKKARAIWPALKLRAVREETVEGRVTQTARAPGLDWWPGGPGNFPQGAVKAGLVFVVDPGVEVSGPSGNSGDRGLRIWNPRTRKVTVRVPGRVPAVVDTHDNLVAWCSGYCHDYRITNGRTGKTRRMKPPPGYSFQFGYDGAFSPDGTLLALPVVPARDAERRDHKQPNDARWSMALVNVPRGTARIVTGSSLNPDFHVMAWSASDKRLYFSAAGGRVMAYRPDAPKATRVARVDGTIFHMAAL